MDYNSIRRRFLDRHADEAEVASGYGKHGVYGVLYVRGRGGG